MIGLCYWSIVWCVLQMSWSDLHINQMITCICSLVIIEIETYLSIETKGWVLNKFYNMKNVHFDFLIYIFMFWNTFEQSIISHIII